MVSRSTHSAHNYYYAMCKINGLTSLYSTVYVMYMYMYMYMYYTVLVLYCTCSFRSIDRSTRVRTYVRTYPRTARRRLDFGRPGRPAGVRCRLDWARDPNVKLVQVLFTVISSIVDVCCYFAVAPLKASLTKTSS